MNKVSCGSELASWPSAAWPLPTPEEVNSLEPGRCTGHTAWLVGCHQPEERAASPGPAAPQCVPRCPGQAPPGGMGAKQPEGFDVTSAMPAGFLQWAEQWSKSKQAGWLRAPTSSADKAVLCLILGHQRRKTAPGSIQAASPEPGPGQGWDGEAPPISWRGRLARAVPDGCHVGTGTWLLDAQVSRQCWKSR